MPLRTEGKDLGLQVPETAQANCAGHLGKD